MKYTFNDWDKRVHAILERIDDDVFGSFLIGSMAKNKYYVIFVDAFSWKCWIFFIEKKDQTFSKFVEFKALVENEIRKKVKALRSDNGGEYVSNGFKFFVERKAFNGS